MRALATVAMLVGVDDERGPQLYKIDPAGHFFPFKVCMYSTLVQYHHLNPSSDHDPAVYTYTCVHTYIQATAAGVKQDEAINWLEKKVTDLPSLDVSATVQMAIMALQSVLSTDFRGTEIEVRNAKTRQ